MVNSKPDVSSIRDQRVREENVVPRARAMAMLAHTAGKAHGSSQDLRQMEDPVRAAELLFEAAIQAEQTLHEGTSQDEVRQMPGESPFGYAMRLVAWLALTNEGDEPVQLDSKESVELYIRGARGTLCRQFIYARKPAGVAAALQAHKEYAYTTPTSQRREYFVEQLRISGVNDELLEKYNNLLCDLAVHGFTSESEAEYKFNARLQRVRAVTDQRRRPKHVKLLMCMNEVPMEPICVLSPYNAFLGFSTDPPEWFERLQTKLRLGENGMRIFGDYQDKTFVPEELYYSRR